MKSDPLQASSEASPIEVSGTPFQIYVHGITAWLSLPRVVYSSGNVKESEQAILKKEISKPSSTKEHESVDVSNLQNGELFAGQCLENHERTSGYQYSLSGALETEAAASPFIANEIPGEEAAAAAVDAEGNAVVSGEVKPVAFGFPFVT